MRISDWSSDVCSSDLDRMFDALSDRFDGIFKRLRGKGKLREEDVEEVLREIRVALLEADVNFSVVKGMLAHIRGRTVGLELSEALNQIGRASGRERVCQYVKISVVGVS